MGTREIHTRCLAAFFTCCMALAFAEPTAAQMMADTIEVRHLSIEIDEIGRESHGSENIYGRPAAFPPVTPEEAIADDAGIPLPSADIPQRHWSIYMEPYSRHGGLHPDWHRMWINTAVLSGAFLGTLFVLQCLPEDATAWNRAAYQNTTFYSRWYKNIFVKNPEIDHDNAIFNYVLHPYAGAAYFMAARSCGFSFWGSMLYSALISTVGWEFGVEACMERPSYQDIIITPVVGSILGELFYKCKRHIVEHDYTLWGSRIMGNIVVFLVDPVNEVVNLFRGSYERKAHLGTDNPSVIRERPLVTSTLTPAIVGGAPGFTLT
ncbi:DUF3943 domain-containing protein, partial [Xylanibacter rodentium]|uniref:DUF3943 domain-containing protein n=1 Tax=Xylanibacter rodentium TaxID=2736289 RepID=UPI002598BF76